MPDTLTLHTFEPPSSPRGFGGADDAHAVLAAGSKSFRFASLFLAPDTRDDAARLYVFCRTVDDLADDAPDADAAAEALSQLSAELRGESPARPLARDTLALFARRGIPVQAALDLIAGALSDTRPVRVADDAELVRYGYRVAGTVGLMMSGVLGSRDVAAPPHAVDLGIAMQITNICRDVREDAQLGRVYLPATRLRAAGIDPTPEGVLAAGDKVRVVVLDLLSLADRYYASAQDGVRYLPLRARFAILIAARVYAAIGTLLRARGGDALAGRVVTTTWQKIGCVLDALWTLPRASRSRAPHRPMLHGPIVGWPGADPRAQGR